MLPLLESYIAQYFYAPGNIWTIAVIYRAVQTCQIQINLQ